MFEATRRPLWATYCGEVTHANLGATPAREFGLTGYRIRLTRFPASVESDIWSGGRGIEHKPNQTMSSQVGNEAWLVFSSLAENGSSLEGGGDWPPLRCAKA